MAKLSRSPWLLHYDASSCNGCDIEVLACLTPVYDVERFGVINTGDPMQADILLVTGGVNTQNAPVLKQIYDQMSNPKVVVAIGACACTGGVFKETYNILGGADKVILMITPEFASIRDSETVSMTLLSIYLTSVMF